MCWCTYVLINSRVRRWNGIRSSGCGQSTWWPVINAKTKRGDVLMCWCAYVLINSRVRRWNGIWSYCCGQSTCWPVKNAKTKRVDVPMYRCENVPMKQPGSEVEIHSELRLWSINVLTCKKCKDEAGWCTNVPMWECTNETAGFGGGMKYRIRLEVRITQSCSPDNYRDCPMAVSIFNLASPDSYRDCSIVLNGCFNLAQWLFQSLNPSSPPQPDKFPDG